ncbi:MAG TPA: hypothetical protein VK184_14350 [Nostocaceae cyanobacterium]|nr:hypothetical protein [Nostocaceae cyanobacterium]
MAFLFLVQGKMRSLCTFFVISTKSDRHYNFTLTFKLFLGLISA